MTTTTRDSEPRAVEPDAGSDRPPRGWRRYLPRTSAQWALAVFVLYLVVAFFALIYHFGNMYWFNSDEWGFLAGRNLGDVPDLFRPQNQHWSTGPIVVYKVLYQLFGLVSYRPYQVAVVLLHLTLAVLIRLVMRRAGVQPWIATAAAATIVLFGPGGQSILSGVQVSQTGTMVFGFTHVLLADHDGRINKRDWLGLLAGLAGLMFSGIAPAMVGVVAVAVFIRRGWLAAAFNALPLAAVYYVWNLIEQPGITTPGGARGSIDKTIEFVANGEAGALSELGHFAIVGLLLGVMLVVGLVLAWLPLSWRELRSQAAVPAALLLGSVALLATVSLSGRWIFGADFARQSRYLYMSVAFLLPALAVAADAIARRWRLMTPVVIVLLLFGIPWNLGEFGRNDFSESFYAKQRQLLVELSKSPLATKVPPDLRPDPSPFTGSYVTVGFLLEAQRDGKLPEVEPLGILAKAQFPLRLGLEEVREGHILDERCTVQFGTTEVTPKVGDLLVYTGPFQVSLPAGKGYTPPLVFDTNRSNTLRVVLPDLKLRLFSATNFGVCPGGPN